MDRFLKAKHWQIFLVTIGLPLIIEIIAIPIMISGNNPSVFIRFMPIIMIFFMFGFFGWFWAIATGLQYKVPEGVKMKVKKFKVFFFIPLIYIISSFVSMGIILGNGSETTQKLNDGQVLEVIGLIVPLHLFSMFCIFYCLYFVAKTYKTVDLQREVTFSDFAGDFFLFWFFPVGIWIIQPKINKMVEEAKTW